MFVVVTDQFPGYWGKGQTEEEAMRECKRRARRAPGYLIYEIDPWWDDATVNEMGNVIATVESEEKELATEFPMPTRTIWRVGPRGGNRRIVIDPSMEKHICFIDNSTCEQCEGK